MSPWHGQMDYLLKETLMKVFLIALNRNALTCASMHTNLVLFHKLCETGPNVVLNHCGRSEFLAPTSKVGAQIESCKRKYKIKIHKDIKKYIYIYNCLSKSLPFENKVEPVSNDSHPYHLGANTVTEMEPNGEINRENITWVTHY